MMVCGIRGEKRSGNEFTRQSVGRIESDLGQQGCVEAEYPAAMLPKRGEFDVYIFPQIVDDKPLFIVSQYGAHHIFIPVVFLSQ